MRIKKSYHELAEIVKEKKYWNLMDMQWVYGWVLLKIPESDYHERIKSVLNDNYDAKINASFYFVFYQYNGTQLGIFICTYLGQPDH